VLYLEEQKDGEESSQHSGNQFHVGRLRQAEQVHEVTLGQQSKLIAEAGAGSASLVRCTHVKLLNTWSDLLAIGVEVGLAVVLVKTLDELLVLLLDSSVVNEDRA